LIAATALLCLSLNIYHESRGESERVQEAVAAITMNRVERMEGPNSVCNVVYSSHQFTWTKNKRSKVKDKEALSKAKKIASAYLHGKINKQVGKRVYFNHKRMGKRYRTPNKPIVLGQLVFY